MKKHTLTPSSRLIGLATLALAFSTPARADLIQYQFSGIVDEVAPVLAGEFAVGEIVTGTFFLDTTPFSSISGSALYPTSGWSVAFGGDYSFGAATDGLWVYDNSGGVNDAIVGGIDPLTAPSVAGRSPLDFNLNLLFPATAFSSTAMPLSVPLGAVTWDRSKINFAADDSEPVSFQLTSFAAVPEPALAGTLGAGALLLASRRRSRIR